MSGGIPSQADPGATLVLEKPKPRDLPHVGETFGAYRIERELGHGGMGAVYAAEHLESGRRVALKVLSRQLDSPDARARFLREGRLAASINHPNSVYVFGTEEIGGTPVISMELIAGGTLQERIQRGGPMAVGEAVDAALQIIAGLEAAQAIGILHRDIKPANCFEDTDGTVKVGDFGLSISTQARGESHLTLPGDFLGTPAFCSPEQLRGDELNVRSDMYSVGVTLFYLLTGRTPFEGKNMVQLLANALEKPAPSPSQFRAEIPQSLSRVVLRCLEKIPAARFASYEELRRALQPFTSTAPTPATLGLRFVAEVVDQFVFFVVNMLVPRLVFGDVLYFTDPTHFRTTEWMLLTGGLFTTKALYYAILEGVWGASLGKLVVGLRVARLNRSAPGIPRALGRFLLLAWPALLTYGFYQYDPQAQQSQLLAFGGMVVWSVFLLAMFSTVRRRNAFAAVHDLLTGTRVIQKAAYQPRAATAPTVESVTTTEAMPKLGPFHVLSTLSTSDEQTILLGYDTRLLRKAWLRKTKAGEPPVPAALRNVARPTRLRWLQGHRNGGESWDAYEAVEGTPLVSLLHERQPWRNVRHWLLDLASELDAAAKDGSMPDVLALDRVWITAEGRAKLLDFAAPAVPTVIESGRALPPSVFLNQVAISALEGRVATVEEATTCAVKTPLPIEARNVVREFGTAASLPSIVEKLRPLMQRTPEISRRRRLALVLGSSLPSVLFGTFMVLGLAIMQSTMHSNPLLHELGPCLQAYETLGEAVKAKGMEHVTLPEATSAMEIYIAHKFGHLILDPKVWSIPMVKGMIPPQRRAAAEKMLADHPRITEADFLQAQAKLKPLLTSHVKGRSEILQQTTKMLPVILTGVIGVCALTSAALCLLCAVAFRGGLLFRILGVAVVKDDGTDASRMRMLWRGLIAWSPVLFCVVLLWLTLPSGPDSLAASGAALGSLIIGFAVASLFPRERSLQDAFAGTWLVPR